ncbi:hypothetical protein JL722_6261 [Aureococcus anophagefferens]|nr:hypothetical protein JL722_6261 [Aureococcus anophagefferens]
MRPLCAWICVVAAPATAFLRPQGPPQRRSLRASPGDDWEPREDWALLDNVDAFTRRGAAGPYLFYDELRSTSAALSGRSAGDVRRRLAALEDCPPDWTPRTGARRARARAAPSRRRSPAAPSSRTPSSSRRRSHAGDARPLAGDSFYVESSTTVTQKLKGDDGQAVTRVQRQRSTRSNSNPQERVETQTVVKRTAKDDAGNLVVTTTRDRSVNSASRAARPASSAEMAKLLKQGLLAPARRRRCLPRSALRPPPATPAR